MLLSDIDAEIPFTSERAHILGFVHLAINAGGRGKSYLLAHVVPIYPIAKSS
jgi:hypothetical protein